MVKLFYQFLGSAALLSGFNSIGQVGLVARKLGKITGAFDPNHLALDVWILAFVQTIDNNESRMF